MSRRRTAANPYLPAETNPFGQQQNPFVPTNENIEQGVAPTEPEGPRVVTRPDTPQTAKPRGEVVTVDASLDRMKVAVVCEGCGQRGLLRLGQVSDSTRCRCGSARVELLEASRRTAMPVMRTSVPSEYLVTCPGVGLQPTEKHYFHYDKATRQIDEGTVAACLACNHKVRVKRDGTVGSHQITEAGFRSSYNKVKHLLNWEASRRTAQTEWFPSVPSSATEKDIAAAVLTLLDLGWSPTSADDLDFKANKILNAINSRPNSADAADLKQALDEGTYWADSGVLDKWVGWLGGEFAAWDWSEVPQSHSLYGSRFSQRPSRRRVAEKECTCWEGYERVPGTEPCASGSCRKKTSRRTTANRVYKVEVWGYEDYEDSDSLVANSNTYTDYTVIVAAPDAETARWAAIEYSDGAGLIDPDAQVLEDLTGSSVRIDITAGSKPKKRAHRRIAAEGWMKSLNPHHRYKTVVKNGYELNLFASDVDYRWTVDAMVTGDSSSLELFEQGIGTSLEDAKRQAEQSAQFFQG